VLAAGSRDPSQNRNCGIIVRLETSVQCRATQGKPELQGCGVVLPGDPARSDSDRQERIETRFDVEDSAVLTDNLDTSER